MRLFAHEKLLEQRDLSAVIRAVLHDTVQHLAHGIVLTDDLCRELIVPQRFHLRSERSMAVAQPVEGG